MVLFFYIQERNDRIIQYLHKQNFPFVLIGKPYDRKEEITYVDNDNYTAAREVAEYLISLGHKQNRVHRRWIRFTCNERSFGWYE